MFSLHRSAKTLRRALTLSAMGFLVTLTAHAAAREGATRVVPLPEAGLELRLWEEPAADGTPRPFYAIHDESGEIRGRALPAGRRITLVDFDFDPLLEGEPEVDEALAARPSNRLFLVQMVTQALPELQQRVRETGALVHRRYHQQALLVEMPPSLLREVESLPFVRWVGPYHPAYRLERELRRALAGEGGTLGEGRFSIMLLERGVEVQRRLGDRIAALGGAVEITTPEGFRMEASLGPRALLEIAHDDRVQYIDRWGGPGETDMDIVREVGGADYVEGLTGYTGQGVRGEIFDTETLVTHQEWGGRTIIVHNPSGSTSGSLHGTSCTSNVFASGINPLARGMCPDGQPIFFKYSESTQFGGAVTRHTIAEQLLDPAGPYRAVFQTSSVGSTRTTDYTTISAEMDDVLFLHQVLHSQSQSNGCNDGGGPQMSRPQAWAKNIVAVGGIRHLDTADRDDDFWCTSTGASIGLAADGRVKPDLAFFYDSIFSASGSGSSSYTSFGGTSSATPQTAGHFGLLFQMWHEGVWPGRGGGASVFDSRPQMITAKALMAHHAHRYDWVSGPPSNADITRAVQGWGTADVRNLYDAALETTIIDEEVVLEPLESFVTTMNVESGEPELKATLAYIDPQGNPGAVPHRINDLSLKVTSPTGTVYWGNNGLTADNFSLPGGAANTIDTVEMVIVPAPEAGTWTVEVSADELVEDAHLETEEIDADFALILSPDSTLVFADGFESGDLSAWSGNFP